MPKWSTAQLIAAIAAFSACASVCARVEEAGIARRAAQAGATPVQATGSTSSPTRLRKNSKAMKTARHSNMAYSLTPTAARGGRFACGKSMPESACTVISWNGMSRTISSRSELDRMASASNRSQWTGPDSTISLKPPAETMLREPPAAMPAYKDEAGLARLDAKTPGLNPPGRDTGYKVSFNLPVGKHESLNLQVGIRKDASGIQGSNDSSVRATWSVKF
ncbi:MAG TPA: hypothetical protein VFF82_11905 [Rhodocyclaceae bacterium]|nr:hypothetical protein [Rhodocyclaceae bacterium]